MVVTRPRQRVRLELLSTGGAAARDARPTTSPPGPGLQRPGPIGREAGLGPAATRIAERYARDEHDGGGEGGGGGGGEMEPREGEDVGMAEGGEAGERARLLQAVHEQVSCTYAWVGRRCSRLCWRGRAQACELPQRVTAASVHFCMSCVRGWAAAWVGRARRRLVFVQAWARACALARALRGCVRGGSECCSECGSDSDQREI